MITRKNVSNLVINKSLTLQPAGFAKAWFNISHLFEHVSLAYTSLRNELQIPRYTVPCKAIEKYKDAGLPRHGEKGAS